MSGERDAGMEENGRTGGKNGTVLVLTGPTAGGKSALALEMARRKGWEILCMDSMQIYRRMDIGTAKPTREERKLVPHHLLDLCEPTESFSVAAWRDRAEALLTDMLREGRQPLLVGGTGLYLQALMHPMAMGAVEANEELRAEMRKEAETPEGRRRLHARLAEIDPPTAERLPVNDVRRIIRALEVTLATGIPFSRQPDREQPSPFRWKAAALRMPREELYQRIHIRVDEMIRAGLPEEVDALLREGVPENAQSMAGLGYKEMIPCLKGQCSLQEAADAIRLGTRHYAKRQITFLKREPQIHYVDARGEEAIRELLGFYGYAE